MAAASETLIKCAKNEEGSIRFRCRDVDRGPFKFDGALALENFANKYAKEKGLSLKLANQPMTQWLFQNQPVASMD